MYYLSPGYEKITGRSCASIYQRPESWTEIIHADDLERVRALAQGPAGADVHRIEYRIVRPDGSVRWIRDRAFPVRNAAGAVYRIAGIGEDITARKQAKDLLRLQGQVAANMAEGVCLVRARDAIIVYTNKRFEKMYSYGPGELLDKPVAICNAAGERSPEETAATIIQSLKETGVWRGEVQNVRKDGTTFGSFASVSTFEHAEHGTVWIGVLSDITERKQAEERHRESEERFRQLAENIDGYVWLTSLDDSEVYYLSPGYEKITGRSCASVYQDPESWTKIIHPDDRDRVLAVARGPLRNEVRQLEYRIVRPDGSVRWIRDRAFPVRNAAGAVYRIAGIGEDITARKQAEEDLRQSYERVQALSRQLIAAQDTERRRLARELHDEVGQALTAVKMSLQAVQRDPGSAASAGRLTDSMEVVTRVLGQVRNLSLDYWPLMLEDLGLGDALESYVDRQAQRWPIKVRFVKALRDSAMPALTALACFRVAQEALTNIARHAQAQNVSVELHQDDAELRLTVRDDGVGFDPTQKGTTVGLQSMRERVSILGGQFAIDSAPGQGTVVRACFPLAAVSQAGNGK